MHTNQCIYVGCTWIIIVSVELVAGGSVFFSDQFFSAYGVYSWSSMYLLIVCGTTCMHFSSLSALASCMTSMRWQRRTGAVSFFFFSSCSFLLFRVDSCLFFLSVCFVTLFLNWNRFRCSWDACGIFFFFFCEVGCLSYTYVVRYLHKNLHRIYIYRSMNFFLCRYILGLARYICLLGICICTIYARSTAYFLLYFVRSSYVSIYLYWHFVLE